MIKHTLSLLWVLFCLSLVLGSCSRSTVPIQVLVPADINMPQHIKHLAIVNRSLPADDKKFGNFVEGLVSGESIYADREGSENCVRGLADKLNSSPRFSANLIEGMDLRGTGTKTFPGLLAWDQVNDICEHYRADALILLETFDSDLSISESKKQETRKQDGKEYTVLVFYANLDIRVNAGWRIYDPLNKQIVDQNVFTDAKRWSGKGNNPDEARKRLPSKRNAINEAGFYAGNQFGYRISPTWINTSRMYYTGKIDDFKRAKKFVQHEEWGNAVSIWEKYTSNSEKKIGGRACFNMGIASEMNGDFEEALKWMKKAYYDYDIKEANQYINIINKRIIDQRRLDEQLGE